MIASMPKVPSPGMAKSVSTTMAPPIRKPTWSPMTVTVGTSAFFSACLSTTGRSARPLARAVVAYSVRMTSSMLVRRAAAQDRRTPVPLDELPEPDHVLDRDRLVEPVRLTNLDRVLLGVGVAEQRHDRIAGDRPHHHEHHEGDHENRRHDLNHA